jgi:hypothetical protein
MEGDWGRVQDDRGRSGIAALPVATTSEPPTAYIGFDHRERLQRKTILVNSQSAVN